MLSERSLPRAEGETAVSTAPGQQVTGDTAPLRLKASEQDEVTPMAMGVTLREGPERLSWGALHSREEGLSGRAGLVTRRQRKN